MKGGGLILDSVLMDQAHTPGRPVNNMLVPGNTVKGMATAYRRTLQVIDTTAAGKTDNVTATGNSPNSRKDERIRADLWQTKNMVTPLFAEIKPADTMKEECDKVNAMDTEV
jgi:hypothetical protein